MIQSKEVQYAKEVDDVLVLIIQLVADIKAKKALVEIGSDCLPKLIEAAAGIDGVKDELAGNRGVVLETVGFRVGQLTDAIIG